MRGKVASPVIDAAISRITPAHAGKRKCHLTLYADAADHPRPCGEKLHGSRHVCLRMGSPPPMRGKAGGLQKGTFARRITPAHAGKSARTERSDGARQDHPRPCGEKNHAFSSKCKRMGSPPPMRGKEIVDGMPRGTDGITPAHAGKRCLPAERSDRGRDHPRPCGAGARGRSRTGSPPPMRGKASISSASLTTSRITPAHAGKSW